MAQFNVRALGVLMNDEGHVLLVKRAPAPGSEFIGWEFCGGGVEHGETPEAALAREYKEETGLKIDVMQIFNARTGKREGQPLLNLAYLCRPLGENVKLTPEHSEFVWVPIEDLDTYDLGPHVNLDRDAFLAISKGSGMIDDQ